LDDSALIAGLRSQDPVAVQELSDRFLPTVWRFVFVRANRDRHLAEDIVSETVLALIKAVSDPELQIQNPGGWLRTVAGNKLADHFRAAARVQHLIDDAKQNSDTFDDDDAVKQQELEERRAEIRGVMDELPEQQRLALEWKYVDRLSVREIAARLGLTEKAAESILFRARKDFRQRMQLQDLDDDGASVGALSKPATASPLEQSKPDDSGADGSASGSQNFGSSFGMASVTHRPST